MIYYAFVLSLYPQDSYEEVMRHLSEADQFGSSWDFPSKVAIFNARLRLGAEPMKKLYEAVAKHWQLLVVRLPSTAGYAWLRSMELALVSLTLSTTLLTSRNQRLRLAKPPMPRRESSASLSVVLTLSTPPMLIPIDRLTPGMLCLGDRGFFSYELCQRAANTGGELLWRAKINYRIETITELEDGSYFGDVYHHKNRARKSPFLLRVIEYQITEGEDHDVIYEPLLHHHRSRDSTGS
jgi:hypothetical protein